MNVFMSPRSEDLGKKQLTDSCPFTKGIRATEEIPHSDGVLIGIDFRHAVEFSRSGRTSRTILEPFSRQPSDPTLLAVQSQTPRNLQMWIWYEGSGLRDLPASAAPGDM